MDKKLSLFGRAVLKFGAWSMLVSGVCTLIVFTTLAVIVLFSGDLVALIIPVFMMLVGLVFAVAGLKQLRKPKTNIEEVR